MVWFCGFLLDKGVFGGGGGWGLSIQRRGSRVQEQSLKAGGDGSIDKGFSWGLGACSQTTKYLNTCGLRMVHSISQLHEHSC